MPTATLVMADYPVGYASGFGETLYNIFLGFPPELLWTAHPRQMSVAPGKNFGQSIPLDFPARPVWLSSRLAYFYYPILKFRQWQAARATVELLKNIVRKHDIRCLLVVPVSPWLLAAARSLHKHIPTLKLVLYVMDDWRGHHESHGLPYTRWRQQLLAEVIQHASIRFAVSREMAAHYQRLSKVEWQVVHNGGWPESLTYVTHGNNTPKQVLLAGDVNVFRYDAVLAFAQALERYNQRTGTTLELTVLGDVAPECRLPLEKLNAVNLPGRTGHAESLRAQAAADLLYLPLAFNERCAHISLYSLPTKLPEYLASGKPVLFHAPRQSAVFQMAERHGLTPRLATTDAAELDRFVNAWALNMPEARSNPERAGVALTQEFDLSQLTQRFQAAFE